MNSAKIWCNLITSKLNSLIFLVTYAQKFRHDKQFPSSKAWKMVRSWFSADVKRIKNTSLKISIAAAIAIVSHSDSLSIY